MVVAGPLIWLFNKITPYYNFFPERDGSPIFSIPYNIWYCCGAMLFQGITSNLFIKDRFRSILNNWLNLKIETWIWHLNLNIETWIWKLKLELDLRVTTIIWSRSNANLYQANWTCPKPWAVALWSAFTGFSWSWCWRPILEIWSPSWHSQVIQIRSIPCKTCLITETRSVGDS